MADNDLLSLLLGGNRTGREGALKGPLTALWSFLQHSPSAIEMHLTALEERFKSLESRLINDLTTAVNTGVVAVEETVSSVEHRLEADVEHAVHNRIARVQERLERVKKCVVEDLKHELRRVAVIASLVVGCAGLALVAGIFALMAAWVELRGFIGSVGASVVLAAVFMMTSFVVFERLRAFLRRSQAPVAAS